MRAHWNERPSVSAARTQRPANTLAAGRAARQELGWELTFSRPSRAMAHRLAESRQVEEEPPSNEPPRAIFPAAISARPPARPLDARSEKVP